MFQKQPVEPKRIAYQMLINRFNQQVTVSTSISTVFLKQLSYVLGTLFDKNC